MCVLLGGFPKFPVDPYYEPLAWFMIRQLTKREDRDTQECRHIYNYNRLPMYYRMHNNNISNYVNIVHHFFDLLSHT